MSTIIPRNEKSPTFTYHKFLDESGDTTFYGNGKIPIIGENGVSKYFILGMLSINEPLNNVRNKIIELQNIIVSDPYFINIPSINKQKNKNGYFLHAKNDIPEVRKMVFEFIKSIDCEFQSVIGRKVYNVYEKKHNGNQAEFYADLLSHLLHSNINNHEKIVLNIAHRSRCTTHINLEKGLKKAIIIAKHKYPDENNFCEIVYNVQQPTNEPIINLTDYFLWALQRKFERNEDRYVEYLSKQIKNTSNLYFEE